jgi:sulfite reductase beta subunit-like hemoprotein
VGHLLEERTSPELLLPTLEAVVKTFDELGDRKDRSRARLKYFVSRVGVEEFRRLVLERRNPETAHYQYERWQEIPSVRRRGTPARVWTGNYKFKRWLDTNVRPQKQKGYAAVYVRLPMGDLTADTLRRMAMISQYFAGGHVRATPSQNLLLRWVHEDNFPELYSVLDDAGLASCSAEQVSDILRCAGADTCLSAITSCRGAALALEDALRDGLSRREEIQPIHINVSGCPHACGQHPLGSIGMQGMAKTFGEYVIPCYRVTVGGRPAAGETKFGQAVGIVPARRISAALKRILEVFLGNRRATETFEEFAAREWNAVIRREMKALEEISAESVRTESLSHDLGSTDEFRIQAKRGECSV